MEKSTRGFTLGHSVRDGAIYSSRPIPQSLLGTIATFETGLTKREYKLIEPLCLQEESQTWIEALKSGILANLAYSER